MLLAALTFGVRTELIVDSDLRSFMPPANDADQRLLLDEIGEGPASRLLLLAIGEAPSEKLAALAQGLAHALHDDAKFSRVLDGETDPAVKIGFT